ncbi:MAG: SpoIIE family protein phosphatase [Lachnospiraceae bacterium]|jgi:serine/threonine protein phosphatase PrpC|nr:SpoIIE family protein phosphatase [Lachnospiraceae bacterium]
MAEELKIAAYALSSTGKELNLDNMYVNGRYVNVGSDTQSVFNKISHADFQIYGVCDSEIGTDDSRERGAANSNAVMQMFQHLQTTLTDVGKIEKERIWDALVETNRAFKRQKNDALLDEMGSSFAGLFLHGNRGLAVHLGDSRIYVVRGGRMLQITDDHLESSDMYRLGVISQSQAEVHKGSSHLTAYLGMDDIYDAKEEAFSKYFVFYPGDTFLICTDGVSDAISNEEMERMIRLLKDASIDTLATMIMKAATDHSEDDMTLMVLRVEEAPGEAPKRGTSTIPRKENFEKKTRPSGEDTSRQSLLSKIPKGVRKTEPEDENIDFDASPDSRPTPARLSPRPRTLSPLQEDPIYDDEDDQESILDRLLSNRKQLALLIGGAVVVILLLIIIISAFSKEDTPQNSSSAPNLESSTLIDSNISNNSDASSPDNSSNSNNSQDSQSQQNSGDSSSPDSSSPNSSEPNSSAVTTVQDYTVEDGDYFSSIVLYFYDSADVSLMEAFAAYNDMTLDTPLYPGMVLKVPPVEELNQ